MIGRAAGLASLLLLSGCSKVGIHGVGAGFTLADVSWFQSEQTLFVFTEVFAEQGIGDPSVVEITYTTDDGRVPWTPIDELPSVHPHVAVDCGPNALCGSNSVFVPQPPRQVGVRLRYHRDGDLSLIADPVFNIVDSGPVHTNRSLIIYGVFDERNELVQWRGRHTFPTLRNERVEELGLRREFVIRDQRHGSSSTLATLGNPYGYGTICPSFFVDAGIDEVGTNARAVFNPEEIPDAASTSSVVCGDATVFDAVGEFTVNAIARKNPEVRPAFPTLRTPVVDATPIKFFLAPCERVISEEHEAMQRQRLQMEDVPTTCTDDFQQADFVERLVVTFRDAIEAERPAGNDMVLSIALHQDDDEVATALEDALVQITPDERHRSTPRVAGAFVLDSSIRGLGQRRLEAVTLWCPATIPLVQIPDASERTCAVAPDNIMFELGPLTFGALPILPPRDQYLDFTETFSDAQAGRVDTLAFRTPEFAASTDHVDLEEFGVVTFLNGERISADANDAFSFCVGEQEADFTVFRSELMANPQIAELLFESCEELGIGRDNCDAASMGLSPLSGLPAWHDVFGENSYELGLFWEFPFLLRMNYEVVTAGAISAFGFGVPFGIAQPEEAYYGTELWTQQEFPLDNNLIQCDRFCDHPTFGSAGVYRVTEPFRTTYATSCYLPSYPQLGDDGFPIDP